MQYPTTIEYRSKAKDAESGKKLKVIIDRKKSFPSRSRAKKFLKDHPLQEFISVKSEGRPEKVQEEK